MDAKLRELLGDLGIAINESLSDSDRIAEAIEKIRDAGYDVFLVLEAAVGFNKREGEPLDKLPHIPSEPAFKNGRVNFTSQDERFARSLKITLDGDN